MNPSELQALARTLGIGFAAFGSIRVYERLLSLASNEGDSPKGSITEVMDDCQAMIVFGMGYSLEPKVTDCPDGRGWISPMAYGYDYHTLIRQKGNDMIATLEKLGAEGELAPKRLKGLRGTVCVDTSPINDRLAALSAEGAFATTNGAVALDGIGAACHVGILLLAAIDEEVRQELAVLDRGAEAKWYGRVGDGKVLEEVLTECLHPSCANCGRCIKVCPGGAIRRDGPIIREKCLSYISQSKEEPSNEFKALLGNRIYGCDDCQTCCPINMIRITTGSVDSNCIPLDQMEAISNKAFKAQYGQMGFAWRGAGIIRRNAAIVRRNQKV